jgi:hypothetical protein
MVVAILPDCTKLKTVVDGLAASGGDLGRLRVLTCEEVPTELATSGVQFVWIGDVERSEQGGIITGGGGTGIPGTMNRSPNVVEGDELLESLSDLAVPDARTDDYARAVEDGRAVLGYPSGANASVIRQLFLSAGATTVEEF